MCTGTDKFYPESRPRLRLCWGESSFFIGYVFLCGIRIEHLKMQFVSGKGSS